MGKNFDVIVIGSGHNGLVNACYLQKAGLNVLVLEKNDWIGGAAVSRELHPGILYSNCSYVCSLFRPEIMRDLELPKHGLQIVAIEGGTVFTKDGDYLASFRNYHAKKRELERFSVKDSESYSRYSRDILKQCRFIQPLLMRTAPDPASFKFRDLSEMLYILRKVNDLTASELADTVRFWTMSISDFLDEYFENDVIKASLAVSGIIGTALGPMSPGTAYVLLHHYMGEVDGSIGAWGYARGGMGAISKALTSSFRAMGGTLLNNSEVEKVDIRGARVKGVILKNGDEYLAKNVVSNADVKRTFLKLTDPEHLPPNFIKKVNNFKIRGSSGKVNIALDSMPNFPVISENNPCLKGDIHFTDSIERMERAYDDWKMGTWSRDPFLDMMIPTLTDPTMAPPGKHFMSCFVQYCPPKVGGQNWTKENKDAFGETVIQQIADYSPGFKDKILHMEVRTPKELEEEVGLTEGNIFQGELTFDQLLFNRPIPGYAQYRSPIKGLYMCGSSTHPGGGVMGAPGRNAAVEILKDLNLPDSDIRDAYEVL
ncbi:NAD(P)/FAD-dependent oxidoreductase [Paracoccaceae bacterium]|nr:NAD(P)/FAD-dependent oxidoreductase [Paracoccaceae bacterium]